MSRPADETTPAVSTEPALAAENAALRARVDALETEIAQIRSSTVQTLASAQETLYWFERWGVDFNSVMARPQAETARKVVRALRSVYRRLVKTKRRFLK